MMSEVFAFFRQIPGAYQSLLLALHRYFDSEDSDGRIEEHDIPQLKDFQFNRGLARAGIIWLTENGLLERGTYQNENGHFSYWELIPNAAELIYAEVGFTDGANSLTPIKSTAELDIIPSSNRFIHLDHNSGPVREVEQTLVELAEAVRGSNELFANADQKLAILSEPEGIRTTLAQPLARAVQIFELTRQSGVLSWIAREASAGVIRDLAVKGSSQPS